MKHRMYYPGLDLMRGISAILILLYHYTARYNENPITDGGKTDWTINIPWGCAAVTTFFILSGFLTSKYIQNTDIGGGGNFLKNRIIRLYPSLIICMILTFTVTNLCFKPAAGEFKDMIFSLTLVPQLFGAKYIDGAYWTLRIEFLFYVFVAFLMYLPVRYKQYCIMLLCAGSILLYPMNHLYGCNIITRMLVYIVNPAWIGSFSIGMAVFFLNYNRRDKFFQLILLLSIISEFLWQDTYHNVFFVITSLLLIIFTNCDNTDTLQKIRLSRLFMWYGKISYPLYLIHQLVGFTIIYYLQTWGYTSTWTILIPIAISSFLGWMIHICIERPASKKLIKV